MSSFDLMLVLCLSITLICIILVIFVLFVLYYKAKRKNYQGGIENDKLSKEIENDIKKHNCKNYDCYQTLYKKKKKSERVSTIFGVLINTLLAILFLGSLSFAIVMNVNSNSLNIQSNHLLLIKTSSMASQHSNNSYLDMESNKNPYKSTRIQPYTLIALDEYKDSSQIKLYDIVAFKIEDTTIVHRVIEISDKNGVKTFTFRGDANPYSLKEEVSVSEDRIIGVYNGYQSIPLGYTIGYMQSTIGIISVCFIVISILGYTIVYEKLEKSHNLAYEKLLKEKVRDELIVEAPARQSDIYVRLIKHN